MVSRVGKRRGGRLVLASCTNRLGHGATNWVVAHRVQPGHHQGVGLDVPAAHEAGPPGFVRPGDETRWRPRG